MIHVIRIIPADDDKPIQEVSEGYTLERAQEAVGGFIEFVYSTIFGLTLMVNEEGLLRGLPPNARATALVRPDVLRASGGIRGDAALVDLMHPDSKDRPGAPWQITGIGEAELGNGQTVLVNILKSDTRVYVHLLWPGQKGSYAVFEWCSDDSLSMDINNFLAATYEKETANEEPKPL